MANVTENYRLVTRWLHAHLVGPYFATEVVELLTTHAFVESLPLYPPGCLLSGFLRFA